jgi:hypothetical protein
MQTHTEPKTGWTRSAAFLAMIHAWTYSIIVAFNGNEAVTAVFWFDGFIIGCWVLGSNGRAALVDSIRNWKGTKSD